MDDKNTELANWQRCLERITRNKLKWRQRYPNQYLCIAVNSGRFGLGQISDNDKDGHMAVLGDYERKSGKISEATLFLGYKL